MSCLAGGECNVVPHRDGWGRCTACGDETFPLTNEAAGRLPCCGSYSEHLSGCDGVVRQAWALAQAAEQELRLALGALDYGLGKKAIRARVEAALDQVKRIRWEGADPPAERSQERFVGPSE